jgi:poly(3-hydroxyalkanoate) synthetase
MRKYERVPGRMQREAMEFDVLIVVGGPAGHALPPTNTLLGNPAALKKVSDSGGANLLERVNNLQPDLTASQGTPAQVHRIAFELRNDLTLSPRAIVFRISVLELIQYAPATGTGPVLGPKY